MKFFEISFWSHKNFNCFHFWIEKDGNKFQKISILFDHFGKIATRFEAQNNQNFSKFFWKISKSAISFWILFRFANPSKQTPDRTFATSCQNPKFFAGGPEIKIWDLLAGGKLLKTMAPHNKTVTSLSLASRGSRLISASLDRQVKFHNISTFKTVHSVAFPSPVVTVAVAVSNFT